MGGRIERLSLVVGIPDEPQNSGAGPLVSIGIPCLNESATIERAISSALAQTYRNVEIIVADAGSVDDTLSKSTQLAATYSRVRVLDPSPTPIGKLANWTRMLKVCTGQFLLILLPKHRLNRFAVERLCEPFVREGGESLVYVRGCLVWHHQDGTATKVIPARFSAQLSGPEEFRRLLHGNTCETIATLYRLSRLQELGFVDTDLPRTFVWFLNAKLVTSGGVHFVNADIGEWFEMETPVTALEKHLATRSEIPVLYAKLRQVADAMGLDVDVEVHKAAWLAKAECWSADSLRPESVSWTRRRVSSFFREQVFRKMPFVGRLLR